MHDSENGESRGASQTVRALLAMRELLLTGELAAGQRVSEIWAVDRLGVSRTPVRSALARLEEEGFLEALPSGGYSRPTAPDVFIRGRDKVLESYLARPPRYTRHMITSVVITVQDADHATGHSYLALHTGKPGEDGAVGQADASYLIGDFKDTFVRDAETWKFMERRGTLAMKVG